MAVRLLSALGGALIGAAIPGTLMIDLKGIKGVGALGIFIIVYLVNPPRFLGTIGHYNLDRATDNLRVQYQSFEDILNSQPQGGLPDPLKSARGDFETLWFESDASTKRDIDDTTLYSALKIVSQTYRMEEAQSAEMPQSIRWTDICIDYFRNVGDTEHHFQCLLDKSVVFLDLAQKDHTDPEAFVAISKNGDQLLREAFTTAKSPTEKSQASRIWSRFYYNLARPRSGRLSDSWDPNYLTLAVQKMEEAFEIDPGDPNNISTLVRTIQKASELPANQANRDWTDRLKKANDRLIEHWNEAGHEVKDPLSRISKLNVLSVATLQVLKRRLYVHRDVDRNRLDDYRVQINKYAIATQREALALLIASQPALSEQYDFDLYFDLAQMLLVRYKIEKELKITARASTFEEALRNIKQATDGASTRQLAAARMQAATDPLFVTLERDEIGEILKILSLP